MNKSTKVVLIVIGICLAVFLVFGILSAVLIRNVARNVDTGDWDFDESLDEGFEDWGKMFEWNGIGEEFEYHSQQNIDLEGVTEIRISTISADILVSNGSEDLDVTVDLVGYSRKGDSVELVTNKVGKTAYVEIKWPNLNIYSAEGQLSVVIPSDYTGDIFFDGVSSDIKTMTSLENQFGKVSINTISGGTDFTCGFINEVKYDSTSGYLSIFSKVNGIDAETTSGDVFIDGVDSTSGNVDIDTVSGDVELEYTHPCKTKINTVSGDVEITLSFDEEIYVDYDSVSGDIGGDYSSNSSSVKYDIDTISGDLTFR